MARAFERLLRLQRGDLPRGLLLFAYLFLVIAAYLVGQVARDALFLGRFKASLLPFADLTLFLCVTAAVAVYVRAGRRMGLDRLLVGSLALFGVVALALAVLARGAPRPWLFPVVYVWVGVFGVLAPAQVWTLANYVLTPREARRLFGFVGAGATLGATVGGVLSSAVARVFGAESLLVLVSALLLLATLPVRALWRRRPATVGGSAHAPRSRHGLRDSLRLVLGSPHLRAIAGIVVLSSFVTAVASWQFKAMAQRALVTQDALAAFFGTFNASVGVLCVATQVLLTAGILRRFGLGPVLFLLPIGLLFGSGGLLVSGTLAAAVLLKGVDKVLRYSIDRPAVELLYLPVAPEAQAPREVVHRHRGVAGRRRPRRPRGHRLRDPGRAGPRSSRPRHPAVHRPVAGPGLAGAPSLRGHAAREPAATPPRRRSRHDGGARPGDDRGARRPAPRSGPEGDPVRPRRDGRRAATRPPPTPRCAACSSTRTPRCAVAPSGS